MDRPQTDPHSFVKRLISALVMIPPVLGAIFYGYPAFDGLILIVFVILAYEWTKLCGFVWRSFGTILFMISGLGAIAGFVYVDHGWGLAVLFGGGASLFVCHVISRKTDDVSSTSAPRSVRRRPWLVFGLFYIGFALLTLLAVRYENEQGRNLILLLFVIAWAADTGAYAFGRLIGGPKLAPVLSPNKTWAGFIGGIVCAAAVGAGYAWNSATSGVAAVTGIAAGLGIVSQGGDLLESSIKRLFQIKDAGTLIPGHGGLLDRIDSLLAISWAVGIVYWTARDEVFKWM